MKERILIGIINIYDTNSKTIKKKIFFSKTLEKHKKQQRIGKMKQK